MADIKTRNGRTLTAADFDNDPKAQTKAELEAKYAHRFLADNSLRLQRIKKVSQAKTQRSR